MQAERFHRDDVFDVHERKDRHGREDQNRESLVSTRCRCWIEILERFLFNIHPLFSLFSGKTVKEICLEMGNAELLKWCETTLDASSQVKPKFQIKRDVKQSDTANKTGTLENVFHSGLTQTDVADANLGFFQKLMRSFRKIPTANSKPYTPPSFKISHAIEEKYAGDALPHAQMNTKSGKLFYQS